MQKSSTNLAKAEHTTMTSFNQQPMAIPASVQKDRFMDITQCRQRYGCVVNELGLKIAQNSVVSRSVVKLEKRERTMSEESIDDKVDKVDKHLSSMSNQAADFHCQRSLYADETPPCPNLKLSKSFSEVHRKEKHQNQVQKLAEELIQTEETYVQNLQWAVENYGRVLSGKDIKSRLFWNLEEIFEFHRDTLLPMLQRNQNHLLKLFDGFSKLLDEHRFYVYVIYMMNKRRSLKMWQTFRDYFVNLQKELGDKLGIESFLMQPIQRLPRYKMLFNSFLEPLFAICNSTSTSYNKRHSVSCCSLLKKISTLLKIVNEADLIYDIFGICEFKVYHPCNKFRNVFEVNIRNLDENYQFKGKVFIFDRCVICTKIRGQQLLHFACYDASKTIHIIKKVNFFLMSQDKVDAYEFCAEPKLLQECINAIEDVIRFNKYYKLKSAYRTD